jgi:hypothetical protein
VVHVAAAVEVGEDRESLLPAVLGGEPTRRAREEEESEKKDKTGDGLDTPGDAEGGCALLGVLDAAICEGRTILDELRKISCRLAKTDSLSDLRIG